MQDFSLSTKIQANQNELFQYHANPGALNRLIPPWENVRVQRRSDSLEVGSEVVLVNSLFGLPLEWRARHTKLDPPDSFEDIQVSGPFKTWVHEHRFENAGLSQSILCDHVSYEMKFGPLGWLGLPLVQSKLRAMFHYRHWTTQADLRVRAFLESLVGDRKLRIGVTGSTGLIGRRLVDLISVLGHTAVRILRPSTADRQVDFPSSSISVVWQSGRGFSDNASMNGLDAVVHLAGKGIASTRWTEQSKREIRDSRIEGTRNLVDDLCRLDAPPKALVCASGVGIYGNRGSEMLDETASPGDDFLAMLALDWEREARRFERSGGRVSVGRLGVVLHPREGALAKLLLPFQLGLGGPIGDGIQYWSWIDADDAAAAFLYLAANPKSDGAYNFVAPEQRSNKEFTKTLGKVLRRPVVIPAPAFAMRLLLGEMADAMLLASARASCARLAADGFPFRAPNLEGCLSAILGRNNSIGS